MLKTAILAVGLVVSVAPAATACSWFSPCPQPEKHLVRKRKKSPDPVKLEKRVAALETQAKAFEIVADHERKLEGYRSTIISLSIAITRLNARIANLEAAR